MKIQNRRYLSILAFLFVCSTLSFANYKAQASDKDGKLVVLVTWGDIDKTPATNVYIEAHGFVPKERLEKSFVLKMSRPGQYEAALPPGVYDVFVSEGTSIPRCRRVAVSPDSTGYWTLKLEIDDVYTEKSASKKP